MHIVLLCATERGLRFLDRLASLAPNDTVTVFSFGEQQGEPPFLQAIQARATTAGFAFREARNVYATAHRSFWDQPIDLLLAVSWRYIVPREAYAQARLGAFVFHDSMLPRNRGFAPTVWAVTRGEPETGVSLFRMQEQVDTGEIVAQRPVPIGRDDTIATVMDRVTAAYLTVLGDHLASLRAGNARSWPQSAEGSSYNARRTDDDNRIDWTASAESIYNLIRGVTRPYQGAWTTLNGTRLRVWSGRPVQPPDHGAMPPGTVVISNREQGIVVAAGSGAVRLTEVQLGDRDPQAADDVLRDGDVLGG